MDTHLNEKAIINTILCNLHTIFYTVLYNITKLQTIPIIIRWGTLGTFTNIIFKNALPEQNRYSRNILYSLVK